MKTLSKKDTLFTSLMLFSLFFGAGNLIFPPFLGQSAGTAFWPAMIGFILSAVGLPILGVIAVAKSEGLHVLASRVHPMFAMVFTVIIYLAIGPLLGIPRASSLAFEMGVQPFLPNGMKGAGALFLYTFVYFCVAYWLALKPGKLVDRFGKLLTPLLLTLIVLIVVRALFHPFGEPTPPVNSYAKNPFTTGFLEGYFTMDTIAALNFGIVISLTFKQMGMTDKKQVVSSSVRAGVVAVLVLTFIYVMLAYLGSLHGGSTENGAQTLTEIVFTLFGPVGAVLLGLVFTLACLTTSVGLVTSCSQYFAKIVPALSYRMWVTVFAGFSLLVANLGLTKILQVSVPALTAIYPVAILLIVLSFVDHWFGGHRAVYGFATLFVSVVSTTDALMQAGLDVGGIGKFVKSLPFYEVGFSWLVPTGVGLLLGLVFKMVIPHKLTDKQMEGTPAK
ncbi:branched-chain amino acid transport system II carrier protein [Metabacillus iocasae]|uniref:Branched-chain amino acid transport system carrier protein n=1 Tax=Priestia iocasae TaxID=2291674 RepID=A0ABS2QSD9_9BACI|nr:branched-chain amino acid transport system II carrier protein [Metabacillus iocasae]MBM7702218.1 LIVCS family branched-chain amino acid:cation transporter [Metabacillus iocasae]